MQVPSNQLFTGIIVATLFCSILLNTMLWNGRLVVTKPTERDFLTTLEDAGKHK